MRTSLRRYFRHGLFPQLMVFEAVARLGSVTRAAEELHLAQPTVSLQLKKLADTLGVRLFEQRGRLLYLTPAGRLLRESCDELAAWLLRTDERLEPWRSVGGAATHRACQPNWPDDSRAQADSRAQSEPCRDRTPAGALRRGSRRRSDRRLGTPAIRSGSPGGGRAARRPERFCRAREQADDRDAVRGGLRHGFGLMWGRRDERVGRGCGPLSSTTPSRRIDPGKSR